MTGIRMKIVRFVDKHQPGFVECVFTDARGTTHTLIDKIPTFTAEDLWIDSEYPQPGLAPCEVLNRTRDSQGGNLCK